uniref:uncharacterized protein n=1 Tax=Myxine glutinosa TaxID=7769 RepID=UPI00358DED85
MSCEAAAPELDPYQDFSAWLSAQGMKAGFARAMVQELGISGYDELLACADDAQVMTELLNLVKTRFSFAFYAVLRRIMRAMTWRRTASPPQQSPGLSLLLDAIVAMLTSLSQELVRAAQQLGSLDSILLSGTEATEGDPARELADFQEHGEEEPIAGDLHQEEWREGSVDSQVQDTSWESAEDKATKSPVPEGADKRSPCQVGSTPYHGSWDEGQDDSAWGAVQVKKESAVDEPEETEVLMPGDVEVEVEPTCTLEEAPGLIAGPAWWRPGVNKHCEATTDGMKWNSELPKDLSYNIALATSPYNAGDAEGTSIGTYDASSRFKPNSSGGVLLPRLSNEDGSLHVASFSDASDQMMLTESSLINNAAILATAGTRQRSSRGKGRSPSGHANVCWCAECGVLVPSGRQLRAHIATVHAGAGSRVFTCEVCGKTFAQAWMLGRHRRSHTGERPFSCQECGKRFSQGWILERHKRTRRHMNQCNLNG